jgi:hypothetical protein
MCLDVAASCITCKVQQLDTEIERKSSRAFSLNKPSPEGPADSAVVVKAFLKAFLTTLRFMLTPAS